MKKIISLLICLGMLITNLNILANAEEQSAENSTDLITVNSFDNNTLVFIDNETNEEVKIIYMGDVATIYIDDELENIVNVSYVEMTENASNISPFAWGTTYKNVGYVKVDKTDMVSFSLSVLVGVIVGRIVNYIAPEGFSGTNEMSSVLSTILSVAGGMNVISQNDLYVKIMALATTDCEVLYKHKYELYKNRSNGGVFSGYIDTTDPVTVWYDTPWNYSYSAGCRVLVNQYPYN